MSRYSREWESGAPAASSRLPDSPPPVRVSRAPQTAGGIRTRGCPEGSGSPSQPRPREVLCEAGPGRVERAGRGTARWGRYLLPATASRRYGRSAASAQWKWRTSLPCSNQPVVPAGRCATSGGSVCCE